MSEAGEVLARLRKRAEACRLSGNPMMAEEFDEYTNTLDSLQAQVEAMRSALESLTHACEHDFTSADTEHPELGTCDEQTVAFDEDDGETKLTFGHIRRARTALSPIKASDAERREINDAND